MLHWLACCLVGILLSPLLCILLGVLPCSSSQIIIHAIYLQLCVQDIGTTSTLTADRSNDKEEANPEAIAVVLITVPLSTVTSREMVKLTVPGPVVDPVVPDAVAPDAVAPDAVVPDAVAPEVVVPDAVDPLVAVVAVED